MKILFYGAGAIGSIFAGMIARRGYDVTVLARGTRLEEIRQGGIVLQNSMSGEIVRADVKVIDRLDATEVYDYVIVAVHNTQIDTILPVLAANASPNMVFVVNNPMGYQRWIDAVGRERIIVGFPSAGGERKAGVVSYFIGRGLAKLFQATTFGELSGEKTERITTLLGVFADAGFSPEMNKSMDAWQKTHVAVVLPIAKALYRFDSSNYELSKSYGTIRKMVLATRECFDVLKSRGVKVTPSKLNFYYLPTPMIVPVFMLMMKTRIAEYAMAKHTVVAKEEMVVLEKQFRYIIEGSGIATPNLDAL